MCIGILVLVVRSCGRFFCIVTLSLLRFLFMLYIVVALSSSSLLAILHTHNFSFHFSFSSDDEVLIPRLPTRRTKCWECYGTGTSNGNKASIMEKSKLDSMIAQEATAGETKEAKVEMEMVSQIKPWPESQDLPDIKADPLEHAIALLRQGEKTPGQIRTLLKRNKIKLKEAVSILRSAQKKCPMIQVKVEQKIEENLCLICHTNPSEFGISTSCCHFFCVECIQGTLKAIRNSEKDFSGYCPICENSVPTGHQGTPSSGRITGEALTFLQR